MFRKSLLTATALVLCGSVLSAQQKTDRPRDRIVPRWVNFGVPLRVVNGFPVMVMRGQPYMAPVHKNGPPKYRNAIFDNIDWQDKNKKWLKDYGFTLLEDQSCYYESSHYHYCISETGNNALAFFGTGKKARKIGVALDSETGLSGVVNIGIYSATSSGLPGGEISGASATVNTTGKWPLTWVDVDSKLNAGQEYFLAVSCGVGQTHCNGVWDESVYAGTDYWHYREYETYNFGSGTHTYAFSSPWHESKYTGSEGAAIIK